MYLNYINDEFYLHGIEGVNIYQIKLFLLLYTGGVTIFSETADGLQSGLTVWHFPVGILGQVWYLIVSIPDLCNLTYLNVVYNYCQRWRLSVIAAKTKVIVFRKGGFYQEIYVFSIMTQS